MSTIRPLATIAVLAALGLFLAHKINEGPGVALQSDWPQPAGQAAEEAPAWPAAPSAPQVDPMLEVEPVTAPPAPPAIPPLPEQPAPMATPPEGLVEEDVAPPANIPEARYGATQEPTPPAEESATATATTPEPLRSPTPAEEFEAAWPILLQALERNELTRAHLLLSQWRDTPGLSPARRAEVDRLLSDLAGTVVYSMEHRLEPPHQVKQGETLATIAQQHQVPWQLLAKINGLGSSEAVQPGQIIKVVRGPFNAELKIGSGEVTLLLGDRYAGRFPVRASGAAPAEGAWQVDQKRLDPPTGADRKIVLRGPSGQSVELSASPVAPLSVASADMADLYDILSIGSQVTVTR